LPDYKSISSDKSEVTEELTVRVPTCAEAGEYTANVKISYQDGDKTDSKNVPVQIVESPVCPKNVPATPQQPTTPVQPTTPAQEKTVITVGSQSQDLTKGEGGAIYPLTFTNSGSETKTYVIGVTGADDWAAVKISPLQTVTVGAGESKSVYVYLSAKETAETGLHKFTVDVKDASGNAVKQIEMTGNVVEPAGASNDSGSLKKALEIGLIVLVVILIVVALIVFLTRKKDDEEEEAEDEISGQTYY
jgi:uncharacterized membrane protein